MCVRVNESERVRDIKRKIRMRREKVKREREGKKRMREKVTEL